MTINDIMKSYMDNYMNDMEVYSVIGEVISVDEKERTCTVKPLNGDPELSEVRLQSELNGNNGFVIFPKKGSHVIVTYINSTTAFCALVNEIERIEIMISDKVLNFDKDGLLLKSADANLKDELNKLADEVDGLYNFLLDASNPPFISAAGVPVLINPTAAPKLIQKKAKIQQLKIAINSFLK